MRKSMLAIVLLVWLVAGHAPRAGAEVKLHGLFTHKMVLQRGEPVTIWGTADPGEQVTVELTTSQPGENIAHKAGAVADKDGHWRVSVGPLRGGSDYTLTIGKTIKIVDILVGDVWIASGQSNMEWALKQTRDPKDVIAKSQNPNIRLFDVPKTPNATPQRNLGAVKEGKGRRFGRWLECGPDTVPDFSAVGYYFARAMERDTHVPIGIINSSWGGTAAERWVSKQVLESNPEFKGISIAKNCDLYNGMIVPLQPFAFKGVIWYQGETNAGRAKQYFHLMNALIKNWRNDWKQGDFPFLTVQLAPFEAGKYADVREAQLFTSLKVKNSAMAVITDFGDRKNIHPPDKMPVGERLALAARALGNKEKVEYIGPLYDSVKFDGGKATLSFKHIGGGLVAKGGPLTGFTIAGKDGAFVDAEAGIAGNTIVVQSSKVSDPTAVRFGWANYPVVNLFSKEGLPATPFRTDVPDYLK